MGKLQLFALLFGVLLVATPILRVAAEDDEYLDEDSEDDSAPEKKEDETDEKDVAVLTDSNFEDIVEKAEFALVEFYAPWCGHCKSLAPEYAKAATAMKEHDDSIVVAKVDATEEKELAKKFGVSGYPTIKWFVKGKPTEYNGPRDSDGIVKWIKKKTGPPAETITTVEELEKLEKDNEVLIVGYFGDFKGDDHAAFFEAARLADDVIFVQTTSKKVATQAGTGKAPSMAAVKNFQGEERETAEFDKDITAANIDEFVTSEKLPLYLSFEDKNQEKIFDSGIDKQLLLIAKEDDLKKESDTMIMFRKVATENKGKLVFVTVDATDEATSSPVVSFFGLKDEELPKIRAFQISGSKKFKYAGELNVEDVSKWAAGVAEGSIDADYKSEDPPEEDKDGDVQIVVGKTVDTIVKDPTKDVLLEVYAPWCGHCKSLEPIYKKLAKRFAKVDSVVIAKMDGTENEHKEIDIQGFPTILFFPAEKKKEEGAKDDEEDEATAPVVFQGGDRSLKALTKFIKEHATVPYTLPTKKGAKKEEEEEEGGDKTEL
ncbi:hypothetical protein BSKO_04137 [Bryopsis sp. KO-2023]|nr:hypothetical protein BSKO_04137 [Bryopsis sp. KO-2023]